MNDAYTKLSLIGLQELIGNQNRELELFIKRALNGPYFFRKPARNLGLQIKNQRSSLNITFLFISKNDSALHRGRNPGTELDFELVGHFGFDFEYFIPF